MPLQYHYLLTVNACQTICRFKNSKLTSLLTDFFAYTSLIHSRRSIKFRYLPFLKKTKKFIKDSNFQYFSTICSILYALCLISSSSNSPHPFSVVNLLSLVHTYCPPIVNSPYPIFCDLVSGASLAIDST